MTNHAGGSSLLQARKPQPHRHSHKVRKPRNNQHAHFHEEVHRRAVAEHFAGVVTQVISVVQVVDTNGATLGVQTISAPPVTQLIDPSTGLTVNAAGAGVLPTPSLTVPGLEIPSPESSSSSHEAKPLTSAPFLKPSGFHSRPSGFNSSSATTGFLFSNHTTLHSLFANTTRSSSSSTQLWNSSTSSSSATRTSSSSRSPTPVLFTGDADAGGPAATAPHAEPSASVASGPPSQPKPGPPTSTVVGSVVGSVAGLALIFVAALFLLRWRRRHGTGHLLLDGGDASSGSRKALPAPGPGGGGGGGGGNGGTSAMSELQRGGGGGGSGGGSGSGNISMGVPATLAALTGSAAAAQHQQQQRRISQTPSETERGFYRVSGKKLPSVLQHGGDGYTDPRRLSDMSGSGASFRDSVAMFGGPGTPRFAVGSPMRPESGVPVLHPGPAVRTPIAEQGPFSDVFALAPPDDPIGRSHASQDGSRGSGSRFTEEI